MLGRDSTPFMQVFILGAFGYWDKLHFLCSCPAAAVPWSSLTVTPSKKWPLILPFQPFSHSIPHFISEMEPSFWATGAFTSPWFSCLALFKCWVFFGSLMYSLFPGLVTALLDLWAIFYCFFVGEFFFPWLFSALSYLFCFFCVGFNLLHFSNSLSSSSSCMPFLFYLELGCDSLWVYLTTSVRFWFMGLGFSNGAYRIYLACLSGFWDC